MKFDSGKARAFRVDVNKITLRRILRNGNKILELQNIFGKFGVILLSGIS